MQSKLLPHQETEKLKGLSAEQLLQIIAQQQHQNNSTKLSRVTPL
jgi:hypothetical protein